MKGRSVVGTLVLLACSCLRINAIADVAVASNDKPIRNTRRSSTHTFREESVWISTHPDFSEKGAPLPTHSHDVVFVVKQNNIDELKNLLHEVSDPKHEKYGKHMTSDEIAAFTANPDSHKAILDYVKSIGAEIVSESRYEDYVTARAPVSLWEKTFDTTFQTYSHHPDFMGDRVLYEREKKNVEFVRTKEYSIPSSLDEHVAFVMNTVQLPMVKSHAIRPQYVDASSPDFHLDVGILNGFITPAKINQAYNVDSNAGSPLATQAVYASLNEHYSPADLTLFQKYFDLPLQAVDTVNDPRAESQAFCRKFTLCAEGNLDLEYIMAVGRSPTKFGYSDSEMAYYLRDVFDSGAPPLVISISYGIEENYLRLTETAYFEFQAVRLGLMGVTILAATGDDGATSYYSRLNSANCAYSPSYPATCSYVTAVGATQGVESNLPERLCQRDDKGIITGGGGFSTKYAQPAWQSTQVTDYFKIVDGTPKAPVPGYNRAGRGFPDISMSGAWILTIIGGNLTISFGTSASAPILAGMITLLNADRFAVGQPALGFINPRLYANANQFTNDVTVGKNNCTVGTVCCAQGFSATTGWDPTTGLGSLDFKKFKTYLQANPASPPGIPSAAPIVTPAPLSTPLSTPTPEPVVVPVATSNPSGAPTPEPVVVPVATSNPSGAPTVVVVPVATSNPSGAPTPEPVVVPVATSNPSGAPTPEPAVVPVATSDPSGAPTPEPAVVPVATIDPSGAPTPEPAVVPISTIDPTSGPTPEPAVVPISTIDPTRGPTPEPAVVPTTELTKAPARCRTPEPAVVPISTIDPTSGPTPGPVIVPNTGSLTKAPARCADRTPGPSKAKKVKCPKSAKPTKAPRPKRSRRPATGCPTVKKEKCPTA